MARAYTWMAAFLFLVDCVNIASALYDAGRGGRSLPAWIPINLEFTSGVALLCSSWVIYLALVRASPGRVSWVRVLLTHLPATVVFSVLHVSLMTLERIVVHAAFGRRYGLPSPGDLVYEYRKDLVAYIALGLILWLVCRPRRRRSISWRARTYGARRCARSWRCERQATTSSSCSTTGGGP